MRRNPAAYGTSDIVRAAEERGWLLVRQRGSHFTYRKEGWPWALTVVVGDAKRELKRALIRQLIEEEERHG